MHTNLDDIPKPGNALTEVSETELTAVDGGWIIHVFAAAAVIVNACATQPKGTLNGLDPKYRTT